MWIQGSGTFVYDPPREGMKRRTEWWAVLNVHGGNEITRYLRWHLTRRYLDSIQIEQHAWSAHVSVLTGHVVPQNKRHLWKKYHNKEFKFKYSTMIRHAHKFWVVDVFCPELEMVRQELGFTYKSPLHLTIAKDKYI